MEITEMKKADILAELQTLGMSVNPGKKWEELASILTAKRAEISGGEQPKPTESVFPPHEQKPLTDTEKIMNAIGGLADSVGKVAARVNRLENGGKDDFKTDIKAEDVQAAAVGKDKIDAKIVNIVETTLGIDFGIEIKGNNDRPGFELTILVPRRLSTVPTAFRPVRDPVSGNYVIDEKTKRVQEEEYWPGDRRSMQLGTTASYEMIQERCNRIRSYILSVYQKMNKPTPEFKFK